MSLNQSPCPPSLPKIRRWLAKKQRKYSQQPSVGPKDIVSPWDSPVGQPLLVCLDRRWGKVGEGHREIRSCKLRWYTAGKTGRNWYPRRHAYLSILGSHQAPPTMDSSNIPSGKIIHLESQKPHLGVCSVSTTL